MSTINRYHRNPNQVIVRRWTPGMPDNMGRIVGDLRARERLYAEELGADGVDRKAVQEQLSSVRAKLAEIGYA
jgi:hypothetical protein